MIFQSSKNHQDERCTLKLALSKWVGDGEIPDKNYYTIVMKEYTEEKDGQNFGSYST